MDLHMCQVELRASTRRSLADMSVLYTRLSCTFIQSKVLEAKTSSRTRRGESKDKMAAMHGHFVTIPNFFLIAHL